MSLSDVKEIVGILKILKRNTNTPGLLIRIACVILLINGFFHYWNILEGTFISNCPLLPEFIRKCLYDTRLIIVMAIIAAFHFEIWRLVCYPVLKMKLSDEKINVILASIMAIIECTTLIASIYFLLFAINTIIDYFNGLFIIEQKYGRVPYCIAVFILIQPYYMHHYRRLLDIFYKTSTGFFDAENKEILIGDSVIFHKKRYRVERENNTFPDNKKSTEIVISRIGEIVIKLEDALKDKDGNLTVIK